MPVFKIEFHFSQGRQGWKESFHLDSGSPTAALSQSLPVARGRVNLLNGAASLAYLAVHDTEEGGRPLLARPFQVQGKGKAEDPRVGVWVRFTATAGAPRRTYNSANILRGVRAGMLEIGTYHEMRLTDEFRTEVQAYTSLLIGSGMRMRVKDRHAPTGNVIGVAQVEAWGGDVEGNPLPGEPGSLPLSGLALVLALNADGSAVDLPTTAGGFVNVKGMRFLQPSGATRVGLSGRYPVLGTFPGGVAISAELPHPGRYNSGGKVQTDGWIYPRVYKAQITGGGAKKCGPAPSIGSLPTETVPLSDRSPIGAQPGMGPGTPGENPLAPGGTPTRSLRSASDLWAFTFDGYTVGDDKVARPIQIAQVLNAPKTWVVTLSGTQLLQNQSTGIPEDISAGLNVPDNFSIQALQGVLNNVPRGSRLILVGHSLGGMEAQMLAWQVVPLGYSVGRVITFGAPIINIPLPATPYRRFATERDPVLFATPFSLLMKSLGHPEQIPVPLDGLPDDFVTLHNWAYRDAGVMKTSYGAYGNRVDDGPAQKMELGPVIRLPVK